MTAIRINRAKYKRARLPRRADSWLRKCKGPTGQIIKQSHSLQLLQTQLQKLLPQPLINHVQIISLNGNKLTLAADSAVWASQLRHQRNTILSHMSQSSHPPLQQLEIKVSSLFAPPLVRKIHRYMPTQVGHNLELTARAINDPELSAALRRLAGHSSGTPENDRD